MSAPWGRGGSLQVFWHHMPTLQTLVVTCSSSKSPLLGQEIQLTFPRQWEQMLVHHRNALWWPLYVALPFPSDLCPSKQLLPIRHAHRKQVGHFKWGSSQSHFRANLIAHCPCSAFEGTTFFVNNVHLIDVTIHCFAPYFLFVKQITPVNFPNWQWRMFGLPLNTLLLTLKIKMTMQKKRENRDSWIQKGWRGSAYGKILFLSIWKDWFH